MRTTYFRNSRAVSVSQTQILGHHRHNTDSSCEDVLFVKATDRLLICGIADGKSDAQYGVIGGQVSLETVAQYLENSNPDSIKNHPFPDEIPFMITISLRKRLLDLAHSMNANFKDFASTLQILVVDMLCNTYSLIHLGDGCVIGAETNGHISLMSAPDNGLTAYQTWLTTSPNAISHLRITTGSLEQKKRLLLMSDGAVCFCKGRNIPHHARALINTGSAEELLQYLASSNPTDDASCIVIDLGDAENP